MTDDLISRQVLLDIAAQQGHVTFDDILYADTIEAAPVRRGKWIIVDVFGEDPYCCSECGNSVNVYGYHFCPNCGADMREVEHETD
jgi:hypothetical protein